MSWGRGAGDLKTGVGHPKAKKFDDLKNPRQEKMVTERRTSNSAIGTVDRNLNFISLCMFMKGAVS